jgi:hypothetical protein
MRSIWLLLAVDTDKLLGAAGAFGSVVADTSPVKSERPFALFERIL